jgi:acetylornithine deacetylase/succinyl-diaminopimelate desuccinylase-like protein
VKVCLLVAWCFPAVAVAAPAAPSPPPSIERDAREILEQLLLVDTSHGGETKALEPIAERFKQAGVPVEILESAPGRGNLIARLKGTGAKKPLLLLAHVDVVPVEGQPWTTPPFKPVEKDGYLYARGVGDDKSMAAAIVAVALELARDRVPLSRDVIVALTAGEETGGLHGVRWLVEHKRGLADAAVALNEGGPLVLTPDGKKLLYAGISSAEKSFQSFSLTARGRGGHSSMPSPATDPVTPLARALVKVGELRFPAKVLPAVKESLAQRARWEKPPLSKALERAVASAPAIAPADDLILSSEPSVNNQIRTTCVTTMLEAAPQDNVLPTAAKATVNCRIMPDETRESTRDALVRAIADNSIEVKALEDIGVAPPSPVDGEVVQAIRAAAAKLWPGVPVSHSMSAGATDSRHLREIGVAAYGISTAPITLSDALAGHAAHGPDERRQVRWLGDGVRYLKEITLALVR